mgnify:CR=1 FL=1
MKPQPERHTTYKCVVALFTRAWIETLLVRNNIGYDVVALFTRAWIETEDKLALLYKHNVALFTRAWIETPR